MDEFALLLKKRFDENYYLFGLYHRITADIDIIKEDIIAPPLTSSKKISNPFCRTSADIIKEDIKIIMVIKAKSETKTKYQQAEDG